MAMKQLQRNFEDFTKTSLVLYDQQGLCFDARKLTAKRWISISKCPVNISYGQFEMFGEHHNITLSTKVSYHQPAADSLFCKYWLIRARNIISHIRYVGLLKHEKSSTMGTPLVPQSLVIAVHVPFQGVLKPVKSLEPCSSHRHPAAFG